MPACKALACPDLLRYWISGPTRVQRTVSCRGGTQIIGQRIQVGLRYAGQIVTIEVDETTLRVYDQRDHLIKNVPRTSHKAYGHTTNHTTA